MTDKNMDEMLKKSHIEVPCYQADCRLIKKSSNSKLRTFVINIISCVQNVILSSQQMPIIVKTQIILLFVILVVLSTS